MDPLTPAPAAPLLSSGMLPVGDGHVIAFEVAGVREGVPALYLHGGPGGRLTAGYRRKAPADRTLLVGFSQRGAGHSAPSTGDVVTAEDVHAGQPPALRANTTAHLVADIERLREHLGIDAWIVQGVSWGSTLAIAYAQAHPERVRAIVLMAVTTTSRAEVDWITEGVGALYPEAWDVFADFAERHGGFDREDRSPARLRLVESYRRLLTSDDPMLVDAATRAWCAWEDEHVRIGTGEPAPDPAALAIAPSAEKLAEMRAFARSVTHYWANDGFVADWACPWGAPPGSGLLGGMARIARIPAVMIHGRRDVSGPLRTAWEVARRWDAAELIVVEEEGHGGPRMVAAWEEAMHRFVGGGPAGGAATVSP